VHNALRRSERIEQAPDITANRTYQPHYSTANDPRTLRTREALREALLRLLEQKPLDQITIRAIVANANISYVTFFRHHPTKESLLHDIAADQVRGLTDLILPALDARNTRAASTALCAYVDNRRRLWSTLLTGGAAAVLREEFLRIANEVAVSRSDPNNWFPPQLAVILNVSSTIEVLTWWLRQKEPLPIERVAEMHERAVIIPILEAAERGKAKVSGRREKRRPRRVTKKG
jgi:AcrR family transcriptional regulator